MFPPSIVNRMAFPALQHDPEKWEPVFLATNAKRLRGDHAQSKRLLGAARGDNWRWIGAAVPGGSTAFSIRSIRVRFRTPMATASATLPASSSGCLICKRSASTRSGCRRFFPRRWPISATTFPTTSGSIRCSARLEDFDALVSAAHAAGLKVILDLVPNHTSDRHPWFIEAARSRDNPKRDWYIWRDPEPDGSAAEQLAVGIRRQRLGVR